MAKMSRAELQRIAKASTETSRISGGIGKLSRNNFAIPKYKLTANSKLVMIVPLSLCLPFNPFDLDSKEYSDQQPFVFKTSVEDAWEACAELMRENPNVKKQFEDYLGVGMTEAEFSKTGKELALLLNQYRRVDPSVEYVSSATMEAFGEYGRQGAVPHTMDADGILHYEGLLYELSCLEMAFIAPELKEFTESTKKGGKNENMNKNQRTAERQRIRSKLLVTPPRPFSVIRVLVFGVEGEDISPADVKVYMQEKNLTKFNFWITVNKNKIEAFQKQIGSKSDVFPSYVEYEIDTGDSEPMKLWDEASKLVVRSDFYTDKLMGKIQDKSFATLYGEYRNNADIWADQALINSVPAFKPIDDKLLLEAYETSIKKYDREVFREEIVEKFGDTIRRVSEELYEELENASIKNKLSKEVVDVEKDDLAEFLSGDDSEEDINGAAFENAGVTKEFSTLDRGKTIDASNMEDIGSAVQLPNFDRPIV